MSKKKMTLKEFAERYECCSYGTADKEVIIGTEPQTLFISQTNIRNGKGGSPSAAGVRLKKLIAKDKKFAKHVSRKDRIYLLDEYAAELLKPKTTKKTSVSSSDIEKLKEEQQILAAKQREISEKIRQTENSLFIQRNEMIAAAVFKALGREYMSGDEVRIYEYLAGCDDFKIYMNSKTEEVEEENCV